MNATDFLKINFLKDFFSSNYSVFYINLCNFYVLNCINDTTISDTYKEQRIVILSAIKFKYGDFTPPDVQLTLRYH